MTGSALQALSGLLWRERETLEVLLRCLGGGADDLEAIGELADTRHELSVLEIERAVATRRVAAELGLCGEVEPTLAAIAAAAPTGWGAILTGHRRALQALTAGPRRADAVVLAAPAGAEPPPDVQRSLVEFIA